MRRTLLHHGWFEGSCDFVDQWRLSQCVSDAWPGFSSKGSICEAHRPVPGLSHAPSFPAVQVQGSRSNLPPPWLLTPPSPPPGPIPPMLLCLTARMPGSRAWKSSPVQASVKSTSSPRDPCPCSANTHFWLCQPQHTRTNNAETVSAATQENVSCC